MAAPNGILLSCLAVVFLAGGCASTGEQMACISSTEDFQATVLDSRRPVVVLFYKQGCPTCAATESTLSRLSPEYRGRVVFAKCPVMTPFFATINKTLREQYSLNIFPTVIVFVGGSERQRWEAFEAMRSAAEYRKGIDEAIARPMPASAAISK